MNFCAAAAFIGANMCENQSPLSALEKSFITHLAEHQISYGTKEEYAFRFEIFQKKDAENREINSNAENTFTVGHNMFSTWTDAEYKKLLGYRGNNNAAKNVTYLDTTNLADSVDWRAKGAVNPVKNQAQCGSCWAFSAVCAMEGAHFLKTGKLESFSEQEVVDCDTTSYGCNGGCHYAEHETDYKYTARDGSCQYKKTTNVEEVSYNNVPSNSVAQLKAAIAKQPTSVTIEADRSVFQSYKSGVLNSSACGTSLDHAVAAVGYGTEAGQDYYIVRNSWGSSWGEQGYIKIAAVEGAGICGIQLESLYPSTN